MNLSLPFIPVHHVKYSTQPHTMMLEWIEMASRVQVRPSMDIIRSNLHRSICQSELVMMCSLGFEGPAWQCLLWLSLPSTTNYVPSPVDTGSQGMPGTKSQSHEPGDSVPCHPSFTWPPHWVTMARRTMGHLAYIWGPWSYQDGL